MAENVELPDFNVFDALGLSPTRDITHNTVKKAYKRAYLHVHPDKNPPEGHFPNYHQVQRAYDFLGGDQGVLAEHLHRALAKQTSSYEQTFFPEFRHGDARVFQKSRHVTSPSLILSLDFGSSMSSVQAATADGKAVFQISQYPRARAGGFGRGSEVKEVPTLAYYKPNSRTRGLEFGYPPGDRGNWEALEHLKSLIDPQQERSPPASILREKLQGVYNVDDVLIGMLTFLYNHASDQLRKVCGRYNVLGFVAAIPCTYGKLAQERYERLLGRAGWPVEVLQWVWEPEAVGFSALIDAPVLGNLSRDKGGAAVLIIDLGGLTCDAVGHSIESFDPPTGTCITREIARPVGHFGGSGMARYVFEGWIAQHYPERRQNVDRLFDEFWDRVMALGKAEHMNLTHQVDIPLRQAQAILDAVFDGVFEFFEEKLVPIFRARTWDAVVLSGGTSQSQFVRARIRPLLEGRDPILLVDNLPDQATVVTRGALQRFLEASRRLKDICYELKAASLGLRIPDGAATRPRLLKSPGLELQAIDQGIVPFTLFVEQDTPTAIVDNLAVSSLALTFCYCEQPGRGKSGRGSHKDYIDMDVITLSISEVAAEFIARCQLDQSRNHARVTLGVSCQPRPPAEVDFIFWYKLPPRIKGGWWEISRQTYRFTIDPGSGRIILEVV